MNEIKNFICDEDGMGTLEIVIIIGVLIALALLFKDQIKGVWDGLSGQVTKKANSVNFDY